MCYVSKVEEAAGIRPSLPAPTTSTTTARPRRRTAALPDGRGTRRRTAYPRIVVASSLCATSCESVPVYIPLLCPCTPQCPFISRGLAPRHGSPHPCDITAALALLPCNVTPRPGRWRPPAARARCVRAWRGGRGMHDTFRRLLVRRRQRVLDCDLPAPGASAAGGVVSYRIVPTCITTLFKRLPGTQGVLLARWLRLICEGRKIDGLLLLLLLRLPEMRK